MNDSEFLVAIEANPCNPTPRLVYADWLDDQGDPRGELIRVQEELRHIDVPHRASLETRMHELLYDGVQPLMITRSNTIGMDFVLIFPGEFRMGRRKDKNQIAAKLTQPYYLGRVVVTQAEWFRIMSSKLWVGGEYVREGNRYPAIYVNWHDAMAYCETLLEREKELLDGWIYTLPTEAQWEYACRAGTTTAFSFGNDESSVVEYAWVNANATEDGICYSHCVGEKKPNPWGLFDMHGNTAEWCRDYFEVPLPGGIDPFNDVVGSTRVCRAWGSASEPSESGLRHGGLPFTRSRGIGFRVAIVPKRNSGETVHFVETPADLFA